MPPGGTQRPSSWRLMARTRPSSRKTMPVTLTEWRGRSVIRCPFVAEAPEVAREHVDGDLQYPACPVECQPCHLKAVLGTTDPQELGFFLIWAARFALFHEPLHTMAAFG